MVTGTPEQRQVNITHPTLWASLTTKPFWGRLVSRVTNYQIFLATIWTNWLYWSTSRKKFKYECDLFSWVRFLCGESGGRPVFSVGNFPGFCSRFPKKQHRNRTHAYFCTYANLIFLNQLSPFSPNSKTRLATHPTQNSSDLPVSPGRNPTWRSPWRVAVGLSAWFRGPVRITAITTLLPTRSSSILIILPSYTHPREQSCPNNRGEKQIRRSGVNRVTPTRPACLQLPSKCWRFSCVKTQTSGPSWPMLGLGFRLSIR